MKLRWAATLAAVGMVTVAAATLALRDATLSTHQAVPPDSEIELVVDASTKGGERSHNLSQMVEAQVLLCRLEVPSQLVTDVESMSAGRYRVLLAPSLDDTNRRQLRGCLEDWTIDHVRLDVVRLSPR